MMSSLLQIFEGAFGASEATSCEKGTANATVMDGLLPGTLNAALSEAFYTLVTFFIAGAVIHVMQQRSRKKTLQRSAARKAQTFDFPGKGSPAGPTAPSLAARGLQRHSRPNAGPAGAAGVNEGPSAQALRRGGTDGDALAAAVRAGRARELPSLLDAACATAVRNGCEGADLAEVRGLHLQSALRACAARRCFREGLAAYDHMCERGDVTFNGSMWSVLLYCAVEAPQYGRCDEFIARLLGSAVPSSNDFVNIVRFHANKRDAEELIKMMVSLHNMGFVLDTISRNRALSACIAHKALHVAEALVNDKIFGAEMDIIGYNTLMKCYAQAGETTQVFKLYATLRKRNIIPSEVTFGILLDACNESGDVRNAKAVFAEIREIGVRLNIIHYTTLMKVFSKAGHLDKAGELLEEMTRSPETKPDLVTYSTIVKAHADRGNVQTAMRILETMIEQGVTPDSVILNNILGGCSVEPMDSRLIFHVLQRMVSYGLQCSNTTLSILLKAFACNKDWNAALEMLENAPQRLKVYPDARLYAQLSQSCSQAGNGSKALECYVAMVQAAHVNLLSIDEVSSTRVLRHCSACGGTVAARKIHAMVSRPHGGVDLEELKAIVKEHAPETFTSVYQKQA
eukprot:TRINITY_DN32196_c0_g1_i1.p1 TRINITY_DN32196_c0_g1~~TRINITY_DN32196_c0_g1_i1.p1  ORF type:complete len:627 (-),score=135.11 TRINITY_DN32196_c0_g1_i1:82-1962(-)